MATPKKPGKDGPTVDIPIAGFRPRHDKEGIYVCHTFKCRICGGEYPINAMEAMRLVKDFQRKYRPEPGEEIALVCGACSSGPVGILLDEAMQDRRRDRPGH